MHQITPQPQQILIILHKEEIGELQKKKLFIYYRKKNKKPDANLVKELVTWECFLEFLH